MSDLAVGNTPPRIRFEEKERVVQGPLAQIGKPDLTGTTSVAAPLALPVWAEDDAKCSSGLNAPMRNPPPPVELHWSKYRGPGMVTFDKAHREFTKITGGNINEPHSGRTTATAKFSVPGEYILDAVANDYSGDGGGGEVCCWTTSMIKVTVTP